MTALPPTPTPGINKTIAALLAGALSTIVMLIVNRYVQPPFSAEMGESIQTVLTAILVYYVPHGGDA